MDPIKIPNLVFLIEIVPGFLESAGGRAVDPVSVGKRDLSDGSFDDVVVVVVFAVVLIVVVAICRLLVKF